MKTLDEILQEKKRRKEQEEKAETKRLRNVSHAFPPGPSPEVERLGPRFPVRTLLLGDAPLFSQMSQVSPARPLPHSAEPGGGALP